MIYSNKNYNDLIKQTAKIVKAFGNQPTLVLCEDKITLAIEAEITALCGGSIFCEVSTLNRLMKRISSLQDVCSKPSIGLIIKKLLIENNEKLINFKNLNGYSLAGAIAELIAQLKSAKVSPTMLKESANNFSGLFKNKILDIALIYQEYDNYLAKNKLLDTNTKFSLFVDKIKDFNLENYNVILAGFQSVTAQTATLFSEISKRAKRLDFVILHGQENLYVNEVYNFALSLNQAEAKGENPSHERYVILDNLFNTAPKTPVYSDKVQIFSYVSEEDEIIDIAKQIKQQVLNGAFYQDFMLVSSDLNATKSFIKKVFDDYNIPFFIEEKINLSSHPLIKAICDYIDLKTKKFDIVKYKKVLRHTTLFSDTDFINDFIELITSNSYSSTSLLKEDIVEGDKAEIYNNFKNYTFSLPNFYQEETAKSYTLKVKELLKTLSVKDNLDKLAERVKEQNLLETAEFILKGYDYILNILQEIQNILGQDRLTAREFKSLLLSGATYTDLSVIPQKGDRVYIGDFSSCKYRFCKNLFVMGLNSLVPSSMADTSILNESDLKRLDKIQVVIEPKLDIVNARNKEDVAVTLSNFTDKLTLSYSTTLGGKENLPSEILEEVCSCFLVKEKIQLHPNKSTTDNLEIIKKSLLDNYYLICGSPQQILEQEASKYLSEPTSLKNFAVDLSNFKYQKTDVDFSSFYTASQDNKVLLDILDDIICRAKSSLAYTIKGAGKLFFPNNKISASAIESFYSCPYANFLEKGLGVQENDNGEFSVLSLGSFLHSIFEEFKDVLSGKITLTEKEIEEQVNQLIDGLLEKEYKKYTKKAEYINLFNWLRVEVKNVLTTMLSDQTKTQFKPKHFEYAFGFDKSNKGLNIKTKHGDYELRGKIDRVDFVDNLVRIIDYKTGSTSDFENSAKLYSGLKLQLYLYLNVFLEQGFSPAGVYYAPTNDDYIKNGASKEKSLKGKTVNQDDILLKTDSTYSSGSTIIDADLTKKGELKLNNVLSKGTLLALCKYAKLITAKAIDNIKEDFAVVSPSYTSSFKNACQYCKFSALCGFVKEKFNTYRQDVAITEEEIQKIAEEN